MRNKIMYNHQNLIKTPNSFRLVIESQDWVRNHQIWLRIKKIRSLCQCIKKLR